MNGDLDRSIYTWRLGQKPMFILRNGELFLSNTPINSNPKEFLLNNPPKIYSYIYNYLIYGTEIFSESLRFKLQRTKEVTKKKIALNQSIVQDTLEFLNESGNRFTFLVFHFVDTSNYDFGVLQDSWRDNLLRDLIQENRVDYIWSKDLIRSDRAFDPKDVSNFIIPENGHPTTYLNSLIAREIKSFVLNERN